MVRDTISYLCARVAPGLLGFASVAVLTRLLSAEAYGDYALVIAMAGLLNGLLFAWNSQAIFRYHATVDKADRPTLLSTGAAGFVLSLALTVFVVLTLAGIVAPGLGGGARAAGLLLIAAYAVLELSGIMLNLERAATRFLLLQATRATANLVVGGLTAWWTHSGAAVIAAVAGSWLVISLLPAFGGWARSIDPRRVDSKLLLKLFQYGAPLALSIALAQLLSSLDRFMLASLGNLRAVGEYAVGFDLVQFSIGAAASSLSLAFYPLILRTLHEAGEDAARQLLVRYLGWQTALLLPLSAGLAITAPGVAQILVGHDLRVGAASVMPLICATALLGAFKSFYADFSFQVGRWTVGGAITAAVAVAANAALNLWLIPRNGVVGAAQASALSFLAALLLAGVLGRLRGFRLPPPDREIAKAALATGVMTILLWPTIGVVDPAYLAVQVTAGGAIYATTALALDLLGCRTLLGKWLSRA